MPESVVWYLTYRVVENAQVLREERMLHRWYVLDFVGLCAELNDAGLRAEAVGDRLVRAVPSMTGQSCPTHRDARR